MPRIPLPEEQIGGITRTVGTGGAFTAPGVVPQRNLIGPQIAQLGGAIEAAGAATADIADVIQDDFDTARAIEGFNLWNDKGVRQTLYDEDSGYLGKEGKDATGAGRKEAQARITDEAEGISQELDNTTQKKLFRQFVNNRMGEVLTQMDRHEITQGKVYKAGQQQAMQRASVGDSVEALVAGDEETYGVQKGVAVDRAREIADSLGYSDELTEEFVQDTTTAIHAGVIERLIAEGRGDEARAYLDAVDIEEIAPQERPKLRARVQRSALINRAARTSREIIDFIDKEVQDQTPLPIGPGQEPPREPFVDAQGRTIRPLQPGVTILGDPTAQAPEDQLFFRGREILEQQLRAGEINKEERDAILSMIKEEQQFRRDVRVSEAQRALDDGVRHLLENPRSSVGNLPTDLYQDLLETGGLPAINTFSDSGGRFPTNPQVYASILDMRRNPSVIHKPNGDLMTEGEFFLAYQPHLDPRHLEQAMAGYRVMTGAASPEDESIWSATERIDFALRQAGITDEDDIDRLERVIQQRANDETPAGGDRPKGEALQPIVDGVLLDEIRVPESFLGIDILNPDTVLPASLLTPAQIAQGEVDVDGFVVRLRDIPADVRREIEQRIQARGQPITFTEIAEVWFRLGRPQSLDAVDRLGLKGRPKARRDR